MNNKQSNNEQEDARGASDVNALVMLPYCEHRTLAEGRTHKIHIQEVGKPEGALCGFSHPMFTSSILGAVIIDEEWLNQPDPDNDICKRCSKIARSKLAT